MPEKTDDTRELFEVYFNIADELSDPQTTLEDLSPQWVKKAHEFVAHALHSRDDRHLTHLSRYGEPPWPPSLTWAEEYHNTIRLGGSL